MTDFEILYLKEKKKYFQEIYKHKNCNEQWLQSTNNPNLHTLTCFDCGSFMAVEFIAETKPECLYQPATYYVKVYGCTGNDGYVAYR